MPTLSVTTFSLGPECTARRGIEFAVEHGFRGLELGSFSLWPEVMSKEDRRLVRRHAAANGIELSIHFVHRGVAPASHDSQRRNRHLADLVATLELAHDIGARPVVVHAGPIDHPGAADEHVRRESVGYLADFLSEAARTANDTGAVVCVENLPYADGQVIGNFVELVALIETVDDPMVQITLDVGHADLTEGVGPAFDTFGRHVRHIHIHDSDGAQDHYEIGLAKLDFSQHLDRLSSYPYAMAMEIQDHKDPEGSVLRSRDRLKALLGHSAR